MVEPAGINQAKYPLMAEPLDVGAFQFAVTVPFPPATEVITGLPG